MDQQKLTVKDFTNQDPTSDLIFTVEERQLYVHKKVLTTISPVWRRMFLAGFREHTAKEVTLPEKLYEEIVQFLQCVYNPDWPISDDNWECILDLAEEYQIDGIKQRCEQYLLTRDITLRTLVIAQHYGLKILYNEAIAATKCRTFEELEKNTEFRNLNTNTLTHIFKMKINTLREYANEVSQQEKLTKKECEKLKQDKDKYSTSLQNVSKLWETPNMRCFRHMGEGQFDYTCGQCNERIQRETKRIGRDAHKLYYTKYTYRE